MVVVVITASTIARSSVSKSFATAQHHYLAYVTPVEKADVVFNGGASTPPDHSATSTRALELALGKEFNQLHAEKWPSAAADNIAQLAVYTRDDYLLLQTLARAPSDRRYAIFVKQSTLLNDIEIINVSVLKELKLPVPTNAIRPGSPSN
jgi:hypothetical protein